MHRINKLSFFHGLLIGLISVCNYFIKINDTFATTCGTTQFNSCASKCGNLSVLSCDWDSRYNSVSCNCGCDASMVSEYGDFACYYATNTQAYNCSGGGHCSFSHCAVKDFYCFSFSYSNCDYGNVKCRKTYLFNASATSQACSCRYASSYSGGFEECKDYKFYGSSCQYTCPSHAISANAYTIGRRTTTNLGGSITDCRVYIPAGCDATGCYTSHTCSYKS
ncbi:MAG: hypothetical protein NC311_01165 [Muribaculaceae bacterium]|nr:hypothetical protein [Muribaculaceae bacterium]